MSVFQKCLALFYTKYNVFSPYLSDRLAVCLVYVTEED
jgi:hypothetical protein